LLLFLLPRLLLSIQAHPFHKYDERNVKRKEASYEAQKEGFHFICCPREKQASMSNK
jgi:hypothetical protein